MFQKNCASYAICGMEALKVKIDPTCYSFLKTIFNGGEDRQKNLN